MRNIFLIRFLAFVLCSAMVFEVAAIVENVDAISVETDAEMEHEESKEKEKIHWQEPDILMDEVTDDNTEEELSYFCFDCNSPICP